MIGSFPENSGSGGIISLNVDYEGNMNTKSNHQLKHIYSQTNNDKIVMEAQRSSQELSNAPIRQVLVETSSKRGGNEQEKKSASPTRTKAGRMPIQK